jgi:hypothetical protein
MPLPQVPRVIRENVSFDARYQKRVKAITEAMLANAANGGVFDVPLFFLPPGAVLLKAPAVRLITQFTGGGATAVGVTIGTAAAPTLVMANFDAFGAAASGLYVNGTPGAQVEAPAGGQNLIARFTPDAGHNLTALTAGSLELAVFFSAVPDAKWA